MRGRVKDRWLSVDRIVPAGRQAPRRPPPVRHDGARTVQPAQGGHEARGAPRGRRRRWQYLATLALLAGSATFTVIAWG